MEISQAKVIKAKAAAKHDDHYSKGHGTDQRGYCNSCHATFGTHEGAKYRFDPIPSDTEDI